MKYKKLRIDFETRSAVDLRKHGADVYARHPSTSPMCMGFAFDDEPVEIWHPNLPAFEQKLFFDTVLLAVKQGIAVGGWNIAFELAIWNHVMVPRFNWPRLSVEQAHCTMVKAYAAGLPGKLENAAPAAGIELAKDMKGQRVMLQLSKPKAIHERPDGDVIEWHTPESAPEKFEIMYRYCVNDVVVEREIDKRLPDLNPEERATWILDQKINQRGITVDLKAAKTALEVVELEKKKCDAQMRKLTLNKVATCSSVEQLCQWMEWQGVKVTGVTKAEVTTLLSDPTLPPVVRQALELRKAAAKTSTAKIKTMIDRACGDGRIRSTLQFYGAPATGRWAGRGVQIHNLARPTISQDEIEEVFELLDGDPNRIRDQLELVHGSVLQTISSCLRGFLTPVPGCEFIGADFSAIEARVLAWLAGETRVLEIFCTHGKLYEAAAADIYRVQISDITKHDPRRQVGKVAELALGYQGGVGALQSMAQAYQMALAPAYDGLWDVATREHKERALVLWAQNQKKAGISKEEYIASELVKLGWRESHPHTVNFWSAIERAAVDAVLNTGRIFKAGAAGREVKYLVRGSFLWCRLPSGRCIAYPYPKIEKVSTPWGTIKDSMTYMAEELGKWKRHKFYGGLGAENVTQAAARDVLRDAMHRVESQGYPIVLHVHDEAVAEVPKGFGSVEEFEQLMSVVPGWANGLPVKAEGWAGTRYQK